MDSTAYSIGGVALETNLSTYLYYYGEMQITDGGTGATSGCRHVKMNFFGDSFPGTVNNSQNKFSYIQAYSTGNNLSSQVPYFYSELPSSTVAPFTVICTELYRQGFMNDTIRHADEQYGRTLLRTRPEVMIGYHFWALPIVGVMKKSRLFTKLVWGVAKPWAHQMAYEMGALSKGNWVGKFLMGIGIFFSGIIGKILIASKNGKK